jgi:hypothetical protein
MPTITIRANHQGNAGPETFTERIIAANLRDEHYAAQLVERLTWATTDAEEMESASSDAGSGEPDGLERGPNSDGALRRSNPDLARATAMATS